MITSYWRFLVRYSSDNVLFAAVRRRILLQVMLACWHSLSTSQLSIICVFLSFLPIRYNTIDIQIVMLVMGLHKLTNTNPVIWDSTSWRSFFYWGFMFLKYLSLNFQLILVLWLLLFGILVREAVGTGRWLACLSMCTVRQWVLSLCYKEMWGV